MPKYGCFVFYEVNIMNINGSWSNLPSNFYHPPEYSLVHTKGGAKLKESAAADIVKMAQRAWRHRKGFSLLGKTVIQDNTIPGLILDTFDNLGFITREDKLKPKPISKKKTEYGWVMVFHLPPGISFRQIKQKVNFFSDAVKGFVSVEWNGGALVMDVQCNSLPTQVNYNWAPDNSKDLLIPVGVTQKGVEIFNLSSGPHMLVAGVPGFGKSNFLHVLVNSLIDRALICIIDLKRLEFSYLKDHVLLARTEVEAMDLLRALNKEHDRRVNILEQSGCVKVQDYPGEDMPYIVVVIDEVAEIKDDDVHALRNRLERLARATGISIVSATQRPSVKVIDGDSRAQYSARLSYLVADEVNSRMVLGEESPQAAWLPAIKGRGIFKFGVDLKEVQTMFLPLKKAKALVKKLEPRDWSFEIGQKKLLPR